MKVICKIRKHGVENGKIIYAGFLTFNIIDKETSLIVRTTTGLVVKCNESEIENKMKERVRKEVTTLQDAIHNNTIKELFWTDINFAKRLKRVFYAVLDEFFSNNYELVLKY